MRNTALYALCMVFLAIGIHVVESSPAPGAHVLDHGKHRSDQLMFDVSYHGLVIPEPKSHKGSSIPPGDGGHGSNVS